MKHEKHRTCIQEGLKVHPAEQAWALTSHWCSPPTPPSVPISQSLVQGGLPGGGVPSELPQLIPVFPGGTPLLPPVVGGSIPVSSPLPPASFGLVVDPSKKLAASVLDALEPPGSGLDSLDLLPYSETRLDALDSFGSSRGSLDKPSSFLGEAFCHHLKVGKMPSVSSLWRVQLG